MTNVAECCLVTAFRSYVDTDTETSPIGSDACPELVAQSVFRDLIFRASFGKVNDVIRPVIR